MTEQFKPSDAMLSVPPDLAEQSRHIQAALSRHERMLQDIRIRLTPVLTRDERLPVRYLDGRTDHPIFNPSLVTQGDTMLFMSRSSTLRNIKDGCLYYAATPHDTINVMHRLGRGFEHLGHAILDDRLLKQSCAAAQYGIEDARMFFWNGALWAIAAGVSPADGGGLTVTQVLVEIVDARVTQFAVLPSPAGRAEKNWIPHVKDGRLFLVYSLAPLVIYEYAESSLHLRCSQGLIGGQDFALRGGTPFVPWKGGLIGVAHTAPTVLDKRYYQHVFITLDENLNVLDVGEPWFIQKRGIEFACGLAAWGGDLILSYGVSDRAAAFCVLSPSVVDRYASP